MEKKTALQQKTFREEAVQTTQIHQAQTQTFDSTQEDSLKSRILSGLPLLIE